MPRSSHQKRAGARCRRGGDQHPYQNRLLPIQRVSSSSNESAPVVQGRQLSNNRDEDPDEFEPLDPRYFFDDDDDDHHHHHHHPLTAPEAATNAIVAAHAVFEHAQEQQEQQQAAAAAAAGCAQAEKTLSSSGGEAATQVSRDWWTKHMLQHALEPDPDTDLPESGGDSTTSEEDHQEGHQDNKEEGREPENANNEEHYHPHHLRSHEEEDRPGSFDVVCGRGISTDRWPGNQHFRRIVGEYIKPYVEAPDNRTKKAVTTEIVVRMKNSGRFLKENEHTGRWIEVGDDAARSKVGQQLRYQLRSSASESTM